MDPAANNTAAVQRALSGLPPQGAGTQRAIPGALCIAGIPVVSLQFLVAAMRPLFAPFGINVDRLLEQPTQQAGDEAEDRFKCPICLGAYVQPTAIKVCGHVFGASCIDGALKKPKKSPMCRKRLPRGIYSRYTSLECNMSG